MATKQEVIPDLMPDALKQRIRKILLDKAKNPCPFCGTSHFLFIDGYLPIIVSASPGVVPLGGQLVPAVGMVCSNCGFISMHAAGLLGLIQPEDEKK